MPSLAMEHIQICMFKLVILAAASISLMSFGTAAADDKQTATDAQDREPTPAPIRGISKLTAEARTVLSKNIAEFAGRKSVEDLKAELTRRLLYADLNNNGLSIADFARKYRREEALNRIRGMMDIFSADDNGDGVVTTAEFDRAAELDEAQRAKSMRNIPSRVVPPNSDQAKQFALRKMTAFRNADVDNDAEITLAEGYLAPKSEFARHMELSRRGYMERQEIFALDFNGDKIVTKAEIEAGIDLFVKEAAADRISFPAITKPPVPSRYPDVQQPIQPVD